MPRTATRQDRIHLRINPRLKSTIERAAAYSDKTLTDFIDTGFLTLFTFTHPLDDERFSDVDDDCIYWAFVVACWLPIYVLVYWAPRWVA